MMSPKEKDNDLYIVDDELNSNIRRTLVKKLIAFIQLCPLYIILGNWVLEVGSREE